MNIGIERIFFGSDDDDRIVKKLHVFRHDTNLEKYLSKWSGIRILTLPEVFYPKQRKQSFDR